MSGPSQARILASDVLPIESVREDGLWRVVYGDGWQEKKTESVKKVCDVLKRAYKSSTPPSPLALAQFTKCAERVAEFFLFMYERQEIFVRGHSDDTDEVKPPTSSEIASTGSNREEPPQNVVNEVGDSAVVLSRHPVFVRYHFCNVYRELDRGTTYFRSVLLDLERAAAASDGKDDWDCTVLTEVQQKMDTSPTKAAKWMNGKKRKITLEKQQPRWVCIVLWHSYIYRLVNRVESFIGVPFPRLPQRGMSSEAEISQYILKVECYKQDPDVRFFSNAHEICGFRKFYKALRDVTVLNKQRGSKFYTVLDELVCCLNQSQRLETLQLLPQVGPFTAWQIYCDLCEAGCFLMGPEVLLGPGSKGMYNFHASVSVAVLLASEYPAQIRQGRSCCASFYCSYRFLILHFSVHNYPEQMFLHNLEGLEAIFGDLANSKASQFLVDMLVTAQKPIFEELGLVFKYLWPDQLLGGKETEHALCEFHKFSGLVKQRISGRRRLYRSRAALDVKKPCRIHGAQVESNGLENGIFCDTCSSFYCDRCLPNPKPTAVHADWAWICRRCNSFTSQE
jgi:hypothetical protein